MKKKKNEDAEVTPSIIQQEEIKVAGEKKSIMEQQKESEAKVQEALNSQILKIGNIVHDSVPVHDD